MLYNAWPKEIQNILLSSWRLLLSFVFLVCLQGGPYSCGYRVWSGAQLFGVSRLQVIPFRNAVPVDLGGDIAHELAQQLSLGGISVAFSNNHIAAHTHHTQLRGTVHSIRTRTDPDSSGNGAPIPSYQLSAKVSARLVTLASTSNTQEIVVWEYTTTIRDQFLPAIGDPAQPEQTLAATEGNRRRALKRLAKNAAQELYQQLLLAANTVKD